MTLKGPLARLILLFLLQNNSLQQVSGWEPTWESLDARPLPAWYDEAKFGIFIHWGVFSVPAFGSEWFWWLWEGLESPDYVDFVERTEGKRRFSYRDYAPRFDASLYDPQEWATIFQQSGAQYVVLTSKHHEGFCNWDSSTAVPSTYHWNAMDVGPRRDLLGDLAKEIKRAVSPHTNHTLKWGVYHSLFEWFHPAYLNDKKANFTTSTFVDTKTLPELYDLVQQYEPELIWSDGDWEAKSHYWKSTEFLAWYATHSTVKDTAVWNDRWGSDSTCRHGGFLTCADRYSPGRLVPKKWENCMTVDQTSWGMNRNASLSDYLSTQTLIHDLIETVAYNGNLLLNVGPSADGTISPIFVDRLKGMGEWLQVNGPAIYATRPWKFCQNETASHVYYTQQTQTRTLYALLTEWPSTNVLFLKCPQPSTTTTVRLLGYKTNETTSTLEWRRESSLTSGSLSDGMSIVLPTVSPSTIPCQHAWVLALTDITNLYSTSEEDNQEISL